MSENNQHYQLKKKSREEAQLVLEQAKSLNRPVKYLKKGETFSQLKKVKKNVHP